MNNLITNLIFPIKLTSDLLLNYCGLATIITSCEEGDLDSVRVEKRFHYQKIILVLPKNVLFKVFLHN